MDTPAADLGDAPVRVKTRRERPGDINLTSGAQMREYQAIVDRIARTMRGPVLDWGCGHGQIAALLRQRGVDVTAFDWSPSADSDDDIVTLAYYPEIRAHHSRDPVRLPFPDDSFGCVLSCGVLEHVQSPDASLEELHRVLRPGGRLLVYKLPNRFSYIEATARRLGFYYHGKLPDDEIYTRRSAAALVGRHGFQVDASRRTNMLPLILAHPLAQRFAGSIWAANQALARVPGLELLATNVEVDATAL